MLKHPITYTTYDDEVVTEDFYFNLTKVEIIELEVEHKEGLLEWLDKMVKMEDRKQMFAEFKRVVLLAYGEKTPDGKSFIKSKELSDAFANHAAFDVLMIDLATKEDFSANFIIQLLPKDLGEKAAEEEKQRKLAEAKKVNEGSSDVALTNP